MILGTALNNVIITVINFITGVLAARFLMAEGRGELVLILLYPQFAAYLALLGVDRSIAIHAGQYGIHSVRHSVVKVALLITVPATIGALIAIDASVQSHDIRHMAYAFCAFIPAHGVMVAFISVFMGMGDFKSYNRVRLVFNLSYLVGAAIGLAAGVHRPVTFMVSYLAAIYLGALLAIVLAWRQKAAAGSVGAISHASLPFLYKRSVPFIIPHLLYTFSTRIDQLLLAVYLDERSLGIFVVYTTYSTLIGPISHAINANVFHRSIVSDSYNAASLIRISKVIYLLILAVLGVAAHPLISLLYGSSFTEALTAVRILLISSFFLHSSQITNEFLKGKRKTLQDVASHGLYLLTTLLCAYFLINTLQVVGMAIAVLAGNLVRYLVAVGFYLRTTKIPAMSMFGVRKEDISFVARQLDELRNRVRRPSTR